jgi:hypothetical protein
MSTGADPAERAKLFRRAALLLKKEQVSSSENHLGPHDIRREIFKKIVPKHQRTLMMVQPHRHYVPDGDCGETDWPIPGMQGATSLMRPPPFAGPQNWNSLKMPTEITAGQYRRRPRREVGSKVHRDPESRTPRADQQAPFLQIREKRLRDRKRAMRKKRAALAAVRGGGTGGSEWGEGTSAQGSSTSVTALAAPPRRGCQGSTSMGPDGFSASLKDLIFSGPDHRFIDLPPNLQVICILWMICEQLLCNHPPHNLSLISAASFLICS